MRKILIALFLSMLSFGASASVTFSLSSCNVAAGMYGGSVYGFDEAICSFGSTTASSITISNMGNGMIDPSFHGPYGIAIDLGDGSSWVNVYTSATYSNDTLFSSIFTSPINFASMNADQLRFRSDIDHGWNFHNSTGDMTFTVDGSTDLPEPGSIALLGLGVVGLGFLRRRKQK